MSSRNARKHRESVWDYPRPPRLESSHRHVVVEFAGEVIADSRSAYRVLETSHPPTWYIPPADVRRDLLVPADRRSLCEWKGTASYVSLRVGDRESRHAGWFYGDPTGVFVPIRGHFAFYPSRVDACYVDGEKVQAQPGDFYGGWITADVLGPFKGIPGSGHW